MPFVDARGRYGFQPVWVCPDDYDPACAANDVALAEFLIGTGSHKQEYGVVFSDAPARPFTWQEKVVLMTGTIDVGEYLEGITGVDGAKAFRRLYGVSAENPLIYHKCKLPRKGDNKKEVDPFCRFGQESITTGMITQNSHRIGIATMWPSWEGSDWFLFTRNNLVHELGHALDWRLDDPHDPKATGRDLLDKWVGRQNKHRSTPLQRGRALL
ncbi:MAG TPA: hypothetical protein ENJ54_11745 [Chloroflexi bacterium]|nr:hypothetical protein [Chloroflexota bacterium]